MKRFLIITALVLILALSLGLTACNPSKPTSLKNLVGTYELTTFTRAWSEEKDENGEQISHNLLEERGIKAYLILTAEGNGYYVYQDNDHTLSTRIVHIEYTYDEEDAAKIKEVTYTMGPDSGNTPGGGREYLVVYFKGRQKTLSYSSAAIFGQKYSQTARYSKVSKDTTLGYVGKKLGATLTAAPYEVAALQEWQQYNGVYDEGCEYIYYYVDLQRLAQGKADLYYARKEDKIPVVLKDQTVNVQIPTDEAPIVVTIGTHTLYCTHYAVPAANLYRQGEDGMDRWLNNGDKNTPIADQIAAALNEYEEWLANQT